MLASGRGAGVGFFRFDVEALGSGAAGGLERGVEALDVPFTVDALEVVRFDEDMVSQRA